MSNTKQKALDFLESNADIKEVFASTDGFLFTKKSDAINHAKTLNDDHPEVETFSKDQPAKDETKRLSVAELKALKVAVVAEYTELFKTAPDDRLSAKEVQKLIDVEKLKTQGQNA